jgi:hypothetical protein
MNLKYRNPIDLKYKSVCILPNWLFNFLKFFGLATFPCTRRICSIDFRKWYHPEGDGTLTCRYHFSDKKTDDTCKVEYHTPIGISENTDVIIVVQPVLRK